MKWDRRKVRHSSTVPLFLSLSEPQLESATFFHLKRNRRSSELKQGPKETLAKDPPDKKKTNKNNNNKNLKNSHVNA